MPQAVDHLAELTAMRDRDALDISLAGALRDLLQPQRVSIHRCVGDESDRRWLTRAQLGRDDLMASADPLWLDFRSLAPLAQFPDRLQALRLQEVVQTAGVSHRAVFPLTTDLEVVGVLEIDTEQPLDREAYQLVGSILRVFRNFQSLLEYRERDTLTGLLKRKTFDNAFNRLAGEVKASALSLESSPVPDDNVPGSAQRRTPFGLQPHFIAVIDIDHFKRVNDTFGHLIGDEVLLLLSRLMRSVLRYHDRLYRFGGEEFVALMRCRSDAEAGLALRRLRTCINAFAFPQVGSLSVSMGYTLVRAGDSPSQAFARADQAVYWAKHHGRDQIRSHSQLVTDGELTDAAISGDVELF